MDLGVNAIFLISFGQSSLQKLGLKKADSRFPPEKRSDCSVIFQFYVCITEVRGAYKRSRAAGNQACVLYLGFPITQQEQRECALKHINKGFCVSDREFCCFQQISAIYFKHQQCILSISSIPGSPVYSLQIAP